MRLHKGLIPVATLVLAALVIPVTLRSSAEREAEIAQAKAATPDETLARYARATELVQGRRDHEALALLASTRALPLVVTDRSAGGNAPDDIAASGLMVRLGRELCNRTLAAARAGDRPGTTLWLKQARGLAAHLLATRTPTLDALLAARAIDAAAGRTEIRSLTILGQAKAVNTVAKREKRLRQFDQDEVMSRIEEARAHRTEALRKVGMRTVEGGARNQAIRAANRFLDQRENRLAADLIPLYRSQRSLLLPVA